MDENMYKIDDNAIGIICNVYAEQHNIDKPQESSNPALLQTMRVYP